MPRGGVRQYHNRVRYDGGPDNIADDGRAGLWSEAERLEMDRKFREAVARALAPGEGESELGDCPKFKKPC
jgi:hypothetical protein